MMSRILHEIQLYFSVESEKMVLKVEARNILDCSGEIDETGIIIYDGGIFKNRLKYDQLDYILIENSNNIFGLSSRKCFTIDELKVPILINKIQEEAKNEIEKKMRLMQKALISVNLK